ncbi:hypothetical protein ACHQM5_012410 [Ranunculus cassubicifolius]
MIDNVVAVDMDKMVPGVTAIFIFNPARQNFGEIELKHWKDHGLYIVAYKYNTRIDMIEWRTHSNYSTVKSNRVYDTESGDILPGNHFLSLGHEVSVKPTEIGNYGFKSITKMNVGLQASSDYLGVCWLQ